MTESSTFELWTDNTTFTTTSLHIEALNTTASQAPSTTCQVDICTCTAAECSSYLIWAVTGTFLGTCLLCGLIMVLIWRCNLCRFRQATLERVEDRYRVSSIALPPAESLRRVSHRYQARTRWYAGAGEPHVNLGFQIDETPDDYISGGSRIQMMVENGGLENGHGREHARAHTFHHYRKKASNVSNIYENPMSVKRSAEAMAGRYATFPRAAEPHHKLSTASGMYEMPLDDWPGDATDDRKISSVSSYYESPELHPDLEAARRDGDVLGLRKESGVYEVVEPMSSKRYHSNPDMSGILEDGEDMDRRRKSTVYDAPMPELPPGVARRPSPVPELPPRQNSLSPKSGVATIPEPLPRDSPQRTPKLPPRQTSTRRLGMAEELAGYSPEPQHDSLSAYVRVASDGDQDFEDDDERRRKSTVYDAPMPELPPTAARRVSTPKMSPRDAVYQNYGIKNDGDVDDIPFSDDGVPPCPYGDAPAPPVGAVPARPSGDAPSPPSSRSRVPSPPTSAAPTLPGVSTPAFPDGVAPPFQEDLAPTFPEEGLAPAPPQTPGMRTPLPAYLTRDRADSVGSMDTMASEALSERQTHFEMRKIDFDFIPAPDYPEDDVLPSKHARSQSVQGREDDPYRRFDHETDNVTFIS